MTKAEFFKEIAKLKREMQFYIHENEQFIAIFIGKYVLNAIEQESDISLKELKNYIQNEMTCSANSFSKTQFNLLKNLAKHISIK